MCGIIGYAGERDAAPLLLDGLQRLEYRGYDSAGIAVIDDDGAHPYREGRRQARCAAQRARRRLSRRARRHRAHALGDARQAHDRQRPPAHRLPGDVVVIHNGIVENYLELRAELRERGHELRSETDTEVVPHLIESYLNAGDDLLSAFRRTIARLEGAHAIVVVFSSNEPGRIVAARVGNAGGVVVGYGEGEMFVASDLSALLPETQRVAFLADGEIACVRPAALTT